MRGPPEPGKGQAPAPTQQLWAVLEIVVLFAQPTMPQTNLITDRRPVYYGEPL